MNWTDIGAECVGHLQALLRLDTRNPPGNESLAADYLRSVLDAEGIDSVTVGPSPDRASIIARIKGDGSAKPLLLMSHTDVVAVERDKWAQDPFGGQIVDGFIYGRGALDMKSMVAQELQVMLQLKRSGAKLKRDVIFLAAADEETGLGQGAGWIAQHRPELITAEYALNEGGGDHFDLNGVTYYTVQTSEKAIARFKLRAKGSPGHGSVPLADNAVLTLAKALVRIAERPLPIHLSQTTTAHIRNLAAGQAEPLKSALLAVLDPARTDAAIAALPTDDRFKRRLNSVVRNTLSPTILRAGEQANVIPSLAEVTVDGRVIPGISRETFLAEIRDCVGDDVEIEFLKDTPLNKAEFPVDSPLMRTIESVLSDHAPGARVVPKMLSGATDAGFAARLGCKVYGFAPLRNLDPSVLGTVHGHDERINVESMHWGTRVLYDVVERFCTQTL